MEFKNRYYQDDAINAGIKTDNGVLVLPTGSGKSLVAAGLVNAQESKTLILQPSKEILESNFAKAKYYGFDAAIYSASIGKRETGHATYATIGSIINKLDLFSDVGTVIIDECHLVNAKGGQYKKLIETLKPKKLIGMTATPFRLASNSFGAQMRVLTRTKPKMFNDIPYVINPRELVEQGYLLEPEFITKEVDCSMLTANSTGADVSDFALKAFAKRNNIVDKTLGVIRYLDHNHILVFVESVADSQDLVDRLKKFGITASEINANTPKGERSQRLIDFQDGKIKAMVNVGTLTTGYDFPALDCIVDSRPVLSAGLHYQKIGRVVRPYPNKKPVVYDIAGNFDRLGNPLNYVVAKNSSGLPEIYSERGRVTTRFINSTPECETVIPFGKFKDQRLMDIDGDYLEWASKEMKGEWKHVFYSEVMRRQII